MKITKKSLRRIIKEESAKKHPLSSLARKQAGTVGGTLVDPDGYYDMVQKGIDFTNGKAGSALKLTERDVRKIVREEKQRILHEQTPADAGMRAARHEGQVDYLWLAEQIDESARAMEQLLMDVESGLILNDQKSLADDLEELVEAAFQMAVTFDALAESGENHPAPRR